MCRCKVRIEVGAYRSPLLKHESGAFRGIACRQSQFLYLRRHHGKASASVAGARCFYGSVESEELGLARNAVDRCNYPRQPEHCLFERVLLFQQLGLEANGFCYPIFQVGVQLTQALVSIEQLTSFLLRELFGCLPSRALALEPSLKLAD